MTKQPTFTEQIQQAIRDSGLSQSAICNSIDLRISTMSQFLGGRCFLAMPTLDRLMKLLDLRVIRDKPADAIAPTGTKAARKRSSRRKAK